MELQPTPINDLIVLTPSVYRDARGFFLETFRDEDAHAAGLPPFVQQNHSRSSRGVLRGLHFQSRRPQGKLVRVVRGAIFDVAVDLRPDSPTLHRWFGLVLDDERHQQLYIPPGFAHGFLVLSALADVVYQCTDTYDPDDPSGLRWDDPTLGIPWPLEAIGGAPTLSEKDRALPTLA